MFGFLYQMLGGEHEELPRRRGGSIQAVQGPPARVGDFAVGDDAPVHTEPWLQRGDVPGRPAAPAEEPPADGSVVTELRQLAHQHPQR